MAKTDPNEKYLIKTIVPADDSSTTKIYLLNPGDVFAGFGGSRSGLVVRKTASLIVRREDMTGLHDVEYHITNKDVWASIFRAATLPSGEMR